MISSGALAQDGVDGAWTHEPRDEPAGGVGGADASAAPFVRRCR